MAKNQRRGTRPSAFFVKRDFASILAYALESSHASDLI
jgi:hypothetical protein